MAKTAQKKQAATPLLTRDQILGAQDLRRELVAVPEWGGSVYVRTMTGTERDAFEESVLQSNKSIAGVRARMASLCIVDENGARLFSESDIEDLGKKSASALDRIFAVAQRLNGFTAEDVDALEKN